MWSAELGRCDLNRWWGRCYDKANHMGSGYRAARNGGRGVLPHPVCVHGGKQGAMPVAAKRQHDRARGTAAQRGYDHRWQKARNQYLSEHPLCVECVKLDKVVPATVVDHIVPHRGDMGLFWQQDNWQPLCATCHSAHKQRQEKGGGVMGCDKDGVPIDPSHHWNT